MSAVKTTDEDAEPIDLEAALAGLDPAALDALEMVIGPDGTVTFVDLPPELLDIAYALNPDDPLVCERKALLAGGETSGE